MGAAVTQWLHWLTHEIGQAPGVDCTSLVQADSPKAGGQMVSATHEVFCVVMVLELIWSEKLAGIP